VFFPECFIGAYLRPHTGPARLNGFHLGDRPGNLLVPGRQLAAVKMHTFAWLDRAQRGARVAADGTLEFGVQRTMLLHLLSVSGEGVWEG